MRNFVIAATLLCSLTMPTGAVMASQPSPSEPNSAAVRYEKEDLYGVWYSTLDEGDSRAMMLLVLKDDGTATDYLVINAQNHSQRIVQQSTWSYDPERNLFEQIVNDVSVTSDNSPAVISHPQEVIRASVSAVKLGDEVIGIKFKR